MKIVLDGAQLKLMLLKFAKRLGIKTLLRAGRAAARPIYNAAKRMAPVDRGDLRESLRIRQSAKIRNDEVAVWVSHRKKGAHATLQEFGVKPHRMGKRGWHPGHGPHRFMRPAFDAGKDEAIRRARNVIMNEILKITGGGAHGA